MTEAHACRLASALGEADPCPGKACPFWEEGRIVCGCGLERLGLDLEDSELASSLLDLRRALEATRDARRRDLARRAFGGLAPADLSDR